MRFYALVRTLDGISTDVRDPEEVEAFRFAQAPARSLICRVAADLDQPGLVRMELQGERLQTRLHRLLGAACVVLPFETDDLVVGIAHHDHLAPGFPPSPALDLEIEGVVQVDVAEQR